MNEFDYKGWIGSILNNSTSTTEFPTEGSENALYIVRDSGTATAYVWDDGASDYTELAGGGGGGGETQSNWNENNASSAAYVKNRTHWEGEAVAFEGQYCLRGAYLEQIMVDAYSVDLNKTYTLTIGDQTYSNLVPFQDEPQAGLLINAIGNDAFIKGNAPLTSDLPFLYGSFDAGGGNIVALFFVTCPKDATVTISETGSSETPWSYVITGVSYILTAGSPESVEEPVSYSNQNWVGYYNDVGKDLFDIEEDKHYPVTFNGTEYDCQATAWQQPAEGIYLSDGSTLDDSTFFFGKINVSGSFIYGIKTDSKETDKWLGIEIDNITIKDTSVHRLDSKYLPSAVSNIPSAPSSDGTYALQVTVSSRVPYYSWVATS